MTDMQTTNNPFTSTLNRPERPVGSWILMLLGRVLALKQRRMALQLASVFVAVFAFALHSVHADLPPLSEPVWENTNAVSGPPQSIAMASSRDGNNEIYV